MGLFGAARASTAIVSAVRLLLWKGKKMLLRKVGKTRDI